jgi:hypothetical protein
MAATTTIFAEQWDWFCHYFFTSENVKDISYWEKYIDDVEEEHKVNIEVIDLTKDDEIERFKFKNRIDYTLPSLQQWIQQCAYLCLDEEE